MRVEIGSLLSKSKSRELIGILKPGLILGGIPVAEAPLFHVAAMACGRPLAALSNRALPEIVPYRERSGGGGECIGPSRGGFRWRWRTRG